MTNEVNNNEIKDIEITINDKSIKIDTIIFQKMMFLYNSINDGWTIKKREDSYIFSKNHEGKKEILHNDYLHSFMKNNFDINKILS
jgi:hypothetical protein